MTQPLRIAIAGLGTVGTGIVRMVQTHGDKMLARSGREIRIVAVSARSRGKDRGVKLDAFAWEDDPVALARRDDVDLIVEVMGGEDGPAKVLTETALAAGKHVVTANKAMMARHGQALAELAEANDAALRYEAAVAGGIPIMKALTEGLAGNGIERVMGVMNGTCNYILTQMEETGADYEDVLAAAQQLGYAEADPAFDVGGIDAAHKLALLAATAFGTRVDFDGVTIEGIEHISLTDITQARELGYKVKLLGVARMSDEGLEQRMQPVLVPARSSIGQLEGVTNLVVVEGDFVGRTVFTGPGAGEGPTASAIMGDVMDIARGLRIPAFGQPAHSLSAANRAANAGAASHYLRFTLTDAPGTLARIAQILADEGISIDRMRQNDHDGTNVPVLIVTHDCLRSNLDAALSRIAASDVSLAPPVALRIEQV
ncbi:homoserine dehydrogenase [Pontivivens nitratireducens]|uniref:homoserine dehydrogenase n=1 Tax=Pontivivens nitratireducens TaxID=2758038 RepID=UPI00163ABA1A|nr:homoserine dehydrogenase [Pontibrevibacter nitratireducens]